MGRTHRLGGLPVAIIGIGCRFPGAVTDVQSYWKILIEGKDAITEIPSSRMELGRFFDERPAVPGKMMTKWGGFLDRIEEFDAEFFGISPREAERLDPQQRLMLETAWEALEDAGQNRDDLEKVRVGVFVGQWTNDFESRVFAHPEAVDFYMAQGSGRYATSGRISYALGFQGPSLTIDTACSSSLTAIHLAVQSLRSGESALCLAGGVNVILQPHISIAYSQSGMMAKDGRCKFGDARGDGYVRSEGAGLVALKLLDGALADSDRIYAVIRGSAVNNDGSSSGSMGTPSSRGQQALLRMAYEDAGVTPSTVSYVEAHGTGTRVGDPVEVGAIAAVLGEGRAPNHPIRVGSVKTNLGHCEGAAGVAGLMKAALALHRGVVPPSLHCDNLNPNIAWADLNCDVVRTATSWPSLGHPPLAGVSAFGISGTNAHVVLEGPPASSVARGKAVPQFHLLPISARSPHALRALAGRYASRLPGASDINVATVCANAATRRMALEYRAVFAATTASGMVDALASYAAGDAAHAEGAAVAKPRVIFVVPGQGAQWPGMGRQLLASERTFRAALERCDAAISKYVDWSIIEQLGLDPGADSYRMDQIDVIQPVLVAMAIAYADWLKSLGVAPDAVVGHSMGEVGAAHLAGVLDLDQAMRIVCRRSALMRSASGQGAMAIVDLPLEDVRKRLIGHESQLSVAVNNSPRSCVIAGEPPAVNKVLVEFEREGVFARLIKVDVASHSPQMDGPAAALATELDSLVPSAARVPIVSSVLARRADGHEFDAAYWGKNLRQPVRFAESIMALLDEGATIFVELSPHPILTQAVQESAQSAQKTVATVECGRREAPEQLTAFLAAVRIWANGGPLNWRKLVERREQVDLPLYPWQRERHWAREAELRHSAKPAAGGQLALDPSQRAWLHEPKWRPITLSGVAAPSDLRPWLVVGSSKLVEAVCGAFADSGLTASAAPRELAPQAITNAVSDGLAGIVLLGSSDPAELYAPVEILQACSRLQSNRADSRGPKIWIATVGAYAVDGKEAEVEPIQGALWGVGRVIAEEAPNHWGGLIDLEQAREPQASARLLARAILSGTVEDQIALRGDDAFALRLVPLDNSADLPREAPWRADGTYLITGGLGAVGLHIAKRMVAGGVHRLALLNRTALPPRSEWNNVPGHTIEGARIAAVLALETAGASVHLLRGDVADMPDLQRTLAQYAVENWPPIIGVIHAAGVLENRLALDMDARAFDRVIRPKLEGARNLDRIFPNGLFVLFSSISALLGSPGMANYAAANAGLDSLAAARRARGAHALSIQWGPWENAGLHSSAAAQRYMDELRRQGIESFAPEQGAELFNWLSGLDAASIAVVPVDWQKLRAERAGRALTLFKERIAEVRTSDAVAEFRAALESASTQQHRLQVMENTVRQEAAKVLRMPVQQLDPLRQLGTMGFTSLMAVELRNRLEALLGRPLSATITFNYPTVESLARFLVADEPPAPSTASAPPVVIESASVSEDVARIASLSDDEVALKLRAGRRGRA